MDLERDIEEKLINRLTQGVSQWTRRDDIKTVSQLWDNFFKILSKNNKAQLHDQPLTENEKNTIRTQTLLTKHKYTFKLLCTPTSLSVFSNTDQRMI